MKHQWRQHEKQLYLPKASPQIVTVPPQQFFALEGTGDPNGQDFAQRVGVLYSLAYGVRMLPKSGVVPAGYFEYTVYPLEGVWQDTDPQDKSAYRYTIMIRQPDFVTGSVADEAREIVHQKKPHPLLQQVKFVQIEDALSVQMLHNGDYDSEPQSFAAMDQFIHQHNLARRDGTHREIYLSDATKVARDKLKTVLRYGVTAQ